MSFEFAIEHTAPSSHARVGVLHTPHGDIHTPTFMPVGTQAAVKTLTPDELKAANSQIILSNTYHLYLRPGSELIRDFGGLHSFMKWDRPILTDSGGYQVFSLGSLRKVKEEGVTFHSHLDGSVHLFTPESVMKIENDLGADIIMAFDECIPHTADRDYAKNSLERTTRWLGRCVAAHKRPEEQALFGIVQGGMYEDLRLESIRQIIEYDLPGYGIGGLSVGESNEVMYSLLEATVPALPCHKPHYLMGVGNPDNLVVAAGLGIDMFDCVQASRIARHGAFWTREGRKNIKNAQFARQDVPLESECGCLSCAGFSRAYIHHLFKAKEMLAYRLLTIHNIHFLNQLMADLRQAIRDGRYESFKKMFFETYQI